ncbi:MAG: hypothetical protein M3P11_06165 [Actinomycetota bacterium]|nr:hypothetical protein [Actinomycetota bacterium]
MRAVRVVVAEAATADSDPVLAPILEAEGFEVVGSASTADELRDVLATTQPQVVVFDAGMSALTVLSSRDWAPGSGIVVVWPPDVLAPAADERVEPSRAASELGDAVRRARRVYHAAPSFPVVVGGLPAREGRQASGPRRTLTFALASLLIVLGIAAIALQRGHQPGELARPPSPSPSATGPTGPTGPGTPGGNGSGQPAVPPGGGFVPGVAGSGGVASPQPMGPLGLTHPGGHVSGPGGPGPVTSPNGEGGNGPEVPQGSGNTCFNGYGDSGHHGDGDSGHHGDGDSGHHGDGDSGHHGDGDSGHHGDGNSRRGNCGHQGNGSSGLHASGAGGSTGTENGSHRDNGNSDHHGNGKSGHHANVHSARGRREA